MKKSLTKRLALTRTWIVLGVALLAIAAVLLVAAFLSPGSAMPGPASTSSLGSTTRSASTTNLPDTPTPELGPTAEPLAASVNGYTITQSYLSQTVRLNKVLGELSGASTLGVEETLERLIRSELILQGVTAIEEPTQEDVESFITNLEENWGVSDETVVQKLQAVELERLFLEDTIKRLLTVEAGVASLEDEGHNITEWLREQEQDTDIKVFDGVFSAEGAEASPTPQQTAEVEAPTATPRPQSEVPDIAPGFTLSRAGGGLFTLEEQLEEGPVVLVFFEKCG